MLYAILISILRFCININIILAHNNERIKVTIQYIIFYILSNFNYCFDFINTNFSI